jgi:plasmid stabilization system protein ParE
MVAPASHSSASLFLDELEAAFALIASAPNVGHPYRRSPVAGTRRVLLLRSRYHTYYAPLDDELVILAVWHASRGSGPPLRMEAK